MPQTMTPCMNALLASMIRGISLRMGVEVGKRSIIGMNMRMNELTGAVALAQTRKLDNILSILRKKGNAEKYAHGN